MSSYYTASMNFQNDCVSPNTPPPSSEKLILKKYFRSGLPHDYSSPYLNRPIMNYYHHNVIGSGYSSGGSNRTPLSSIENLELSPLVKVQEDVLVMDGVLVNSKSSSKGSFEKFGSSSSSSGGGGSLYKTELCKSWEDTGYCRYGCKCQFAHGQEELRTYPTRSRNMKNLEMQMSKLKPSSLPNPYSPGVLSQDNSPTIQPGTASSTSKLTKQSPVLSKDWSPMDDGIAVSLPGSTNQTPTRADVDEHINNVLYGPTNRKRLSFFRDMCPE